MSNLKNMTDFLSNFLSNLTDFVSNLSNLTDYCFFQIKFSIKIKNNKYLNRFMEYKKYYRILLDIGPPPIPYQRPQNGGRIF